MTRLTSTRLRDARPVAWALGVQKRFSEINGSGLAAAITLRSFLALFPLLVLATAILGYLSVGITDFTEKVVENLGVTGTAAESITDAVEAAQRSRITATVVGLLGLVWAGLGLVIGIDLTFNSAWGVPGRGLIDRAVGAGWLVGAGVITAVSITAVALTASLPWELGIAAVIVATMLDFALLMWTSRIIPNRVIPWRSLVLGSALGALALAVLKLVGTRVVPALVARSSALYGSMGVVFALLVWFLLFGRVAVYVACIQVVGWTDTHGTALPPVKAGVDPEVAWRPSGRGDGPG
ncbi:MAG: YihY/virulence factor BrkB family protein [Acidimicrobiia bacterium]|nr:YihY/virulence factor BrkB family protein [Acidimicrobiia bacterium]